MEQICNSIFYNLQTLLYKFATNIFILSYYTHLINTFPCSCEFDFQLSKMTLKGRKLALSNTAFIFTRYHCNSLHEF